MNMDITSIVQQFPLSSQKFESSVNSSLKHVSDRVRKASLEEHQAEIAAEYTEELSETVENIQKICGMFDRKLQFSVNKDINKVVVKVIDINTDTIIREIPSEEIQRLQMRIKEAMGLLFDQII